MSGASVIAPAMAIATLTIAVNLVIDIHDAGGIPGDFISRAGELFAQGDARSNEGQKIVILTEFVKKK